MKLGHFEIHPAYLGLVMSYGGHHWEWRLDIEADSPHAAVAVAHARASDDAVRVEFARHEVTSTAVPGGRFALPSAGTFRGEAVVSKVQHRSGRVTASLIGRGPIEGIAFPARAGEDGAV
jgi:hypothetical protein